MADDDPAGLATERVTVVPLPTRSAPELPESLAGFAALVVPGGSLAGSRYILEPEVTAIGRDVASDVFLDDVTVSRAHVRLSHHDGRFVLEDLGSLNGTYVNGVLVDQAVLVSGDELRIGRFKLVFLDRTQS